MYAGDRKIEGKWKEQERWVQISNGIYYFIPFLKTKSQNVWRKSNQEKNHIKQSTWPKQLLQTLDQ